MGCTPHYTDYQGFWLPADFPLAAFASALGYAPEDGDIVVDTYPKCGTTWMQYIVYLIVHRGMPLRGRERLTEVFPHLEEVGADAVRALGLPRLMKTHLPFSMTPFAASARYVYVARNPFDCVVSFYHHTRGFPQHYDFSEGTFDEFFECFIHGEVDFGDYFEHLNSWYERQAEANVLFLTYEQMHEHTEAVIQQVARFLGPEHEAAVSDRAVLANILQYSAFTHMRREPLRWASQRPEHMPGFIRKGAVGDWRSHLSREQARRLARKFGDATRGRGAYRLWPDIVEEALRPSAQ